MGMPQGNTTRTAVIVVALIYATAALVVAMPPHPDLVNSSDPTVQKTLTDFAAMCEMKRPVMVDRPLFAPTGTAVAGSRNLLVILVKFSDKDSSVNAAFFDTLIFDQTSSSVYDYYQEVSYGTFSLESVDLPSAVGWRQAPQPYSYYVNGLSGTGPYPNNSQKLCEDLIDLLDPEIDFSNYDADNNGVVDGIVIVHAGSGGEYTGSPDDMWSHQWSIWPPQTRDNKVIREYTVQPEFWALPGDMTIGVFCHELGHMLFGLPDLYDYDGDSHGLGLWSLMASGSWGGPMFKGDYPTHPDVWCKVQMGLVTPTTISGEVVGQSIPSIESSATAFKIWDDGDPLSSEYYLICNRQKTGYDTYLPGNGLLIYHIDDDVVTGNDNQWYPGYTANGHYTVALEQADGLWELEQNVLFDYGDAGDPYPGTTGNRLFTSASTPSSDAYDGSPTYVVVANVSNSAPTMTADFNVDIGAGVLAEEEEIPTAFAVRQNFPNPFNPTTRFEYTLPRAGTVTVELFDVLGRRVRTVFSGTCDAGFHSVRIDARDDREAVLPAGVYFYRVQTATHSQTLKMLLLK